MEPGGAMTSSEQGGSELVGTGSVLGTGWCHVDRHRVGARLGARCRVGRCRCRWSPPTPSL